jgi:uncharacterized membrane protein YozB (DUF420 family)
MGNWTKQNLVDYPEMSVGNVSNQNKTAYVFFKYAGWVYIVLSVLLLQFAVWLRISDLMHPSIFSWIRISDVMPHGAPLDKLEVRYAEYAWLGLLHMIPGLIFVTLAPLQFITRIRQGHIAFHRGMGRVIATCGIVSGLMALPIAFMLPAFGGIGTQAAGVFFGIIFLFSLVRAVQCIRRKEIASHREWMIRAFSLATGAATVRIFFGLLILITGLDFEAVTATSFWLGFSVNLLVAEIWINYTRPHPLKKERGWIH